MSQYSRLRVSQTLLTSRVATSVRTSPSRTIAPQGSPTSITGYIPASHGHYVENTGNTTLRFLEVFKTATFQDVSLSQVRADPALLQICRLTFACSGLLLRRPPWLRLL